MRKCRRKGLGIASAIVASMLWISGAAAEIVVLSNGDLLDATSVERTEEGWILEHAVLGRLALGTDRVTRVGPEPIATPTPTATTTAIEPAAEPALAEGGVLGTHWLVGFERAFSLGLSGARGNSQNLDATAGLDLDFEDDHRRVIFDGRFYYAESEGEETKSQGYADLTRDWRVPNRRHFTFGQIRWDVDEFQDWDHRGSVGGGVGFDWIAEETFELRSRTGLALTRSFGGVDDETDLELLLRVEAEWRPTRHQTVSAYNTLYPSLADTGELRNLTGITWKIRLAGSEGLALQLGLENEYESDVPRDTERDDLQYYASLLVDF